MSLPRCCATRPCAIHTLYEKGEPAGFFELDARIWPDVNLSYFGLMPNAIGQRHRLRLPASAVDEVWRRGAKGMTVNTCTADQPAGAAKLRARWIPRGSPGARDLGGAEQPEHANSVKSEALTTDLALYIHWPFCLAKCPYCDFNSHVRDRIDQTRFALALRRELASEAAKLGRRRLTSVFFGGGTPEPDGSINRWGASGRCGTLVRCSGRS